MPSLGMLMGVGRAGSAGGGGGLTDPDTISGLKACLKADAATLFEDTAGTDAVEDNDGLARWNHSCASPGDYFDQGTSGFRPLVIAAASGLNGKRIVRFDGTDDALVGGALSEYVAASAATLWMVVKVVAVSTSAAATYNNHGLIGDVSGYSGVFAKTGPTIMAYNWDGSDDHANLSFSTGTWYAVGVRHSGGNLGIRLNGGSETAVASGDTSVLTGGMKIGQAGSGSAFTQMDLAELLIWNVALTDQQMTDVRDYLISSARWGAFY